MPELDKDVEKRFDKKFTFLIKPDNVSEYEPITITGSDINEIKQFLAQELASAREEGAREERKRMGDFIENGLKYRYEKLAKVRMKHFTYNSLLDVIKDELTNPLAKDN